MGSMRSLLLLGIFAVSLTLAGAGSSDVASAGARRRRRSVLAPLGPDEDLPFGSLLELSSSSQPHKLAGGIEGARPHEMRNHHHKHHRDDDGKPETPSFPIWAGALLALLVVASAVQSFRSFFIPDELTADTEVLLKLEGMNDTQVIANLKDMDARSSDWLMKELSVRSAVFATIAGLTRIMPDLYAWMTLMSFNPAALVAFIVFNFAPSVGGTVQNVTYGLIGTALSGLLIWIPVHVYPGGYHNGDPLMIWYFGVAWLVGSVVLMLSANFPDGVKVWCLIGHVGNMMGFLVGAHPDVLVSTVIGNIITTFIGAAIAIIGTCLPYPFLENRKAFSGLHKTTILFRILLKDVVTVFTGEGDADFDKGDAIAAQLRGAVDAMGASVGSSWFEHFDFSALTRHSLQCHKDVMQKLAYHVSCIQKAMGGMSPQPDQKEKLVIVQGLIDSLLGNCCKVIEGKDRIDAGKIKELEDAIEGITAGAPGTDAGAPAPGTVMFLLRSMAVTVVDYATRLKNLDPKDIPKDSVTWSIITFWCGAFAYDATRDFTDQKFDGPALAKHINTSMRHIITILSCFAMGYVGYGNVVTPFDAGIALNAAFLLGSVPGSALRANLQKFQGIVLGTAGGQLIFPLIHAEAGLGPAVIAGALFVYIGVTSLIKFSGAEFALTGMLLGVFGSGQMMAPPGAADCDEACVAKGLAGAYKGIISAVISILTMTVVDIALANPWLGREDPKVSARKAFKDFLECVQSACVTIMGEDRKSRDEETSKQIRGLLRRGSKADLLKYVEGMSGKLSSMDTFAEISSGIHSDFNLGMYQAMSVAGRGLLDDLWVLAGAVAEKGSAVLKEDLAVSFKALTNDAMFEEISAFLEGSGAKFSKPGFLLAPNACEAFDIVRDGKQMMGEAADLGKITDPVVEYAAASLLGFKKNVWAAAESTA